LNAEGAENRRGRGEVIVFSAPSALKGFPRGAAVKIIENSNPSF